MDNTQKTEQTLGQKRVRTSFNPSADNKVDVIKQKHAELIDLVNEMEFPEGKDETEKGEFIRLKSLAMTEIQSAGHWAVMAATF